MTAKVDHAELIHNALSRFSRQTATADRIVQEIADRQLALREAEGHISDAVDVLTPLLAELPHDVVIQHEDTVYWLDPTEGLCTSRVRPWTDLLPDDDDAPPIQPLSYGERQARERYIPSDNGLTVQRQDDGTLSLIDPILLTEGEIDAMAAENAIADEPGMPDSVLEAMAEAWDRGDLDATQAIVNGVKLNGRAS